MYRITLSSRKRPLRRICYGEFTGGKPNMLLLVGRFKTCPGLTLSKMHQEKISNLFKAERILNKTLWRSTNKLSTRFIDFQIEWTINTQVEDWAVKH